jgi:xanthine dehydrogenase accessory factor
VRSESLSLLERGESLLLRISPQQEPEQPGKKTVVNTCLSGGSFEVFLEPVVPAPIVAVAGDTPIARALSAVGAAAGFDVVPSGTYELVESSAVVIATHGRAEEQLLVDALTAEVPYVALVASPRRGAAVLESLDLPAEQRNRVSTPAGLDIGARSAGEIAVSILAEIIEARAEELRRTRVPFVHARVVLAERPTSAKPGDEALVLADGSMLGFVGGSCGETTVRSESLSLLERGESLRNRIAPHQEPQQPGKNTVRENSHYRGPREM